MMVIECLLCKDGHGRVKKYPLPHLSSFCAAIFLWATL